MVRLQTTIHEKVPSTFAIEAIAYLQAVKLGIAGDWLGVNVEGDALSVIKKSQSMKANRSEIGVQIQNIQHLNTRFERVLFQYIPRSVNALAHILATTTLKEGREYYLANSIPEFVVH